MYRKGLSSRANKISSLVASTDNSGPGSIGQDAVPTAGAHGIRKNVFRRMPALIPKKSQSRFSKMAIPARPYPFYTRQELIDVIDEYFFTNKDKAWRRYGDIGTWDVSRITDMTRLFCIDGDGGSAAKAALTENELGGISNWNVSNVTNMQAMFRGSQFNGDLSKWNVSNCTTFTQMFQSGSTFNNDSILYWDVRAAGQFNGMFANSPFAVQTINYWNITPGTGTPVDAVTSMFVGNTNFPDGPGITSGTPDANFFNKITFLTGGEAITHERTQPFYDPGATTVTGEIPVVIFNDLDIDVAGIYTITYEATNPRGASGTISRTVTVTDSTAPVITLTGSSTVTLERGATYTDLGATSSEGQAVTNDSATAINDGTNNFTVGTYTINYTTTDAVGNTGTKTRTVNVVDTVAPVFTVNSFIDPHTVYTHPTNTYGPPGNDDVTADDIGAVMLSSNAAEVDITTVGTQTYTLSASDGYNTANMSRTVNVVSIILTITGFSGTQSTPLQHVKDDTWVEPTAGSGYEVTATAAVGILGAANEGDDVSAQIASDVSALDITTLGNYTVTYTINDGNGNIYTAIRYVQVVNA
tara:strand:+ start:4880 stop:6634 length:1755 start_codon:yes stop_codon:yes gene_type:complete